jgi:hypothetical protein
MGNLLKNYDNSMPVINDFFEQINLIKLLNHILVKTNDGRIIPVTNELERFLNINIPSVSGETSKLPNYYLKANTSLLYCLQIANNKLYDIGKWIDYQIEIRNEFTENFNTKKHDYKEISASLYTTINFVEEYILKYETSKTKQKLIKDNIPFETVPIVKKYKVRLDRDKQVLFINDEGMHFVKKRSQEYFILEQLFDNKGIVKKYSTNIAMLSTKIKDNKLTDFRLYSSDNTLKAVSKLNNKISKYYNMESNLIIRVNRKVGGKEHDHIDINRSLIEPQ